MTQCDGDTLVHPNKACQDIRFRTDTEKAVGPHACPRRTKSVTAASRIREVCVMTQCGWFVSGNSYKRGLLQLSREAYCSYHEILVAAIKPLGAGTVKDTVRHVWLMTPCRGTIQAFVQPR